MSSIYSNHKQIHQQLFEPKDQSNAFMSKYQERKTPIVIMEVPIDMNNHGSGGGIRTPDTRIMIPLL